VEKEALLGAERENQMVRATVNTVAIPAEATRTEDTKADTEVRMVILVMVVEEGMEATEVRMVEDMEVMTGPVIRVGAAAREKVAKVRVTKEKVGKEPPKAPKVKVKKWCPAVGMVSNREDCIPDLVEMGILKKIAPCKLEDFWGEYHYLGAIQRIQETYCPPPSVQMVKQLIVEHCMLPLNTDIRQKAPESLVGRSLLLYGPKGSGKSMLARAIATETGSTFFDISPAVIEGKSTAGKIGSSLLVYKVFICAQDMAPSVIYTDQIDQVFTGGKKKKGGDANAPSRIKKDLSAAIQQVKRGQIKDHELSATLAEYVTTHEIEGYATLDDLHRYATIDQLDVLASVAPEATSLGTCVEPAPTL